MAILDEVPGVIATILLESDQVAEELEPPAGCEETYNPGCPRADLPTKYSFIELASGSRFSIEVKFLDGFPLGEGYDAALIKVFVNGNRVFAAGVGSDSWAQEGIYSMKIPLIGSKFTFSPVTQYEKFHDETNSSDSLRAKGLSTVEVIVASGKRTELSNKTSSAPSEQNLRFTTKSLADKKESHAINYQGNVCNPYKRQPWKVEEPWAYVSRFLFYTRTKEVLRSLLIIPRVPLSEAKIEAHVRDLSQGEL